MNGRSIRWDRACDLAAESLGGYEAIDESIFVYLEALHGDPFACPKVDTDWGSIRYIRTKPYGETPSLIWYFLLEVNGDVTIIHVEKY